MHCVTKAHKGTSIHDANDVTLIVDLYDKEALARISV